MSSKIERRLLRDDLIDDIVEPQSSSPPNKPLVFTDSAKLTHNRTHSSLPFLFHKPKCEQPEKPSRTLKNDRSQSKSSHIDPSSLLMNNDERRKEIDRIIQHLYNGKLLSATSDEFSGSENSEPPVRLLNREPAPTLPTVMPAAKVGEEKKSNELPTLDADVTSLRRELKEKELDISHLHKEIQELQLENKLLKAKGGAGVYSNGYTNNNSETEALWREKEILKNELSASQEQIAKFQQQQQSLIIHRTGRLDEIHLQQKEVFENKLKSFEKQMRALASENDKLKQSSHQTERAIIQLKRENDELQQKVTEAKKRNDELFYQEFHSLRNNLKALKERNNLLFQENLRLQQEQQGVVWRSTIHDQQQMPPLGTAKISTADSKHSRLTREESPYMSETSDSTNYLTSVTADRYNARPTASVYRAATIDGNNHQRATRYNALIAQSEMNSNINALPASKSVDQQLNFRSSKSKWTAEWNAQNTQAKEQIHHRDITNCIDDHLMQDHTRPSSHTFQSNHSLHRNSTLHESQLGARGSSSSSTNSHQDDRSQFRKSTLTTSLKRPYAPLSINDIHLGDVIKFSRAGGKVSKGAVKYIGSLPGKTDQYLGLELEDEESKHDGIYQDQRLFQCKPNKGVFVGFNKVIMAWSGQ